MSHLMGRAGHARVGVLTVIGEEFSALQQALGANFEVGTSTAFSVEKPINEISGKRTYPFVLMRCDDRSNLPANTSTKRLIELFQPEVIILVGVAGGIRRLSGESVSGPMPGDVLVSTYVHYAPYSKSEPTGRKQRYFPIAQPAIDLVNHANAIESTVEWNWRSGIAISAPDEQYISRVHFGEIISVEAIAGNPDSEEQQDFIGRFDHADAVDMESSGVGRAIAELGADVHYAPRWVAIRGISDPVAAIPEIVSVDNNGTRAIWKDYASSAAGAFARRLAERLLCDPRDESSADPGVESWAFEKAMSLVAGTIAGEELR